MDFEVKRSDIHETRVVDDPKKVRVAVRRHPQLEGVVEARAEWPNVSGTAMMFGEETFHIPTLLREQPEKRSLFAHGLAAFAGGFAASAFGAGAFPAAGLVAAALTLAAP